MNDLVLKTQKDLDEIKRMEGDFEYWSARDLMGVLGYTKWQTFREVINKAKESCLNSQQAIEDHFTDVGKLIKIATGTAKHIEALYGGMSVLALKRKRNIPEKRALADFDTELELSAKHFSLAITDHNIKKHDIKGKPKLENEVVKNSKATRQTLLSRGIKPEELEAEEDLKRIEKRRDRENLLINK